MASWDNAAGMKFLFDFFPLLLFFAAYKIWDLFVATGVAMAATVAQIGWLLAKRRPIPAVMWTTLVLVLVFGGATILLDDKRFFMWKPTVLYWLFALMLGGAQALFDKSLIKSLMGSQLDLPDAVWRRMSWNWALFFLAMGFANLYVMYQFSEETWATFKVFGATGLTFLFMLAQLPWLAKYVQEKP
jgi:intracellular septation protein